MNVLIEIHEGEEVENQACNFPKEKEACHGSWVKLGSIVLCIKQLFHEVKETSRYKRLVAEALETFLDNFKEVRVEPLKEEVVLLWRCEGFGDSHDGVDESDELKMFSL